MFVQRLLFYFHRILFCVATKDTVTANPLLDAHALHGGFAMIFGMAWTSGNTIAKLQAVMEDAFKED